MSVLGKAAYEPIGANNKPLSRMVEMYTACTEPCIQDIVLDRFQSTNSWHYTKQQQLLLECMGLDCPGQIL